MNPTISQIRLSQVPFMKVSKMSLIMSLAAIALGCQSWPVAEPSAEAPTQPPTAEQSNPFRDAVNKAMEAATLTQTAKTHDEWNTVSAAWQQAISLMQAVPTSHPSYETAQAKVGEYQRNLEYAHQNAQKAKLTAHRMSECEAAVQAAARVSSMADQVEDLDPAIRVCQSLDELTAASEKFPAALDGVDPKTFVSNRCRYEESLKTTPICRTLLAAMQTVHYLAVRPGSPTPDDPVPVFNKQVMVALTAAAESQDLSRVRSILSSPDVERIPGGSIVEVVEISGDLALVELRTRDVQGNDLSGEIRATLSRFVQSQQF
ncbi:hypothetical protein [Thermoleptolyngbya sp. C42_A2020_037]|uniref:hypothetical protein n=1 Tax=Thermoleptolyngbya sp. C42_A2020_037 TaxID=2747799 RepID=UPI0019E671E6|nr:hypothetical protein [Thermoleptolyngbya sp. C42_A2020_037]MBF2082984.1 hypothetical protein [Thermoleptolyngbya sp. C42_A2020_037]